MGNIYILSSFVYNRRTIIIINKPTQNKMIKNNKGKGKTGFKFKNIVGNIGEINYLDKNGDENDARKMLIPINMEEKLLRLQYDMNLEFSNILPLLKKYVYAQ